MQISFRNSLSGWEWAATDEAGFVSRLATLGRQIGGSLIGDGRTV
jgi:hypothetical protein